MQVLDDPGEQYTRDLDQPSGHKHGQLRVPGGSAEQLRHARLGHLGDGEREHGLRRGADPGADVIRAGQQQHGQRHGKLDCRRAGDRLHAAAEQ